MPKQINHSSESFHSFHLQERIKVREEHLMGGCDSDPKVCSELQIYSWNFGSTFSDFETSSQCFLYTSGSSQTQKNPEVATNLWCLWKK